MDDEPVIPLRRGPSRFSEEPDSNFGEQGSDLRSSFPGNDSVAEKPAGTPKKGTWQKVVSSEGGDARRDMTRHGKRKRRRQFIVFARDNFACVYCGRSSISDGVKLQADHIVPYSQGGEDIAGNFVTSCGECNRSKFDYILAPEHIEWLLVLVRYRNKKNGISNNQRVELGRT